MNPAARLPNQRRTKNCHGHFPLHCLHPEATEPAGRLANHRPTTNSCGRSRRHCLHPGWMEPAPQLVNRPWRMNSCGHFPPHCLRPGPMEPGAQPASQPRTMNCRGRLLRRCLRPVLTERAVQLVNRYPATNLRVHRRGLRKLGRMAVAARPHLPECPALLWPFRNSALRVHGQLGRGLNHGRLADRDLANPAQRAGHAGRRRDDGRMGPEVALPPVLRRLPRPRAQGPPRKAATDPSHDPWPASNRAAEAPPKSGPLAQSGARAR